MTMQKDLERKHTRAHTLAMLRLEIAAIKAAETRGEQHPDADILDALECWEQQIADWDSRI